jgi:hypothetical protein
MFLSRSLSGILRKRQYDPQNAGLDNLPVIQAGHHMRICIEKTTSEITYTKWLKINFCDRKMCIYAHGLIFDRKMIYVPRHQAITTRQNRKSKD